MTDTDRRLERIAKALEKIAANTDRALQILETYFEKR